MRQADVDFVVRTDLAIEERERDCRGPDAGVGSGGRRDPGDGGLGV